MDEPAFASATGLAGEIRDRRVGCLELLDFFLERAGRYNPALNAVVAWQVEPARERARAADAALARGEVWGPLHGLPMTVKESFNLAGLPSSWGNPPWKDKIAADNAVLVDRLLAAGAVLRHLRAQAELGSDPDARAFADRRLDPDRYFGGRPDGAACRGSRTRDACPRRTGWAAAGGLAGR